MVFYALTAHDGKICAQEYTGSDNQLWRFLDAGNGCYYIQSKNGFYIGISENGSGGEDLNLTADSEAKYKWKTKDYDFDGCDCYFLESKTGNNIGIEAMTDAPDMTEKNYNVVYNSPAAGYGWSFFGFNRVGNSKYYYFTHNAYGSEAYGEKKQAFTVRENNIVFVEYTGSDDQLWELIDAGNGCFHIRSRSGYYFDLDGAATEQNVNVIPGSSPKYSWRLEVSPGNG